MGGGTLDARQQVEDVNQLGAALAGGDGLHALVVRQAVDPVGGEADGLLLRNRPVCQGSRDDDGKFGRIDPVFERIFGVV